MRAAAFALAVLFCACAREQGAVVTPAPSPTPTPTVGVVVSFGDDKVTAEVAQTVSEQYVGLSNRQELAADAGMLFLFDRPNTGGFYMRDTYIPLSIAYMSRVDARTYEVLVTMDMEPLDTDSSHYDPGVPYDAALEVNRGWFDRAGVGPGDRAHIEGTIPSPASPGVPS